MAKVHLVTFVLILIVSIIIPHYSSASATTYINYDGERMSVHANGVPLKQLLSKVAKQTDILFSYDDVLAITNVYTFFEDESLANGVRRILSPFNYSILYTGSGRITAVLILNKQRGSSKNPDHQPKLYTSLQFSDIDDTSGILSYQEVTPSSDLAAEQGANALNIPPGAKLSEFNEAVIPAPVVDSDMSMPPGAKPPAPIVDPDVTPPPGE